MSRRCWEITRCGREPGGANSLLRGVCPAARPAECPVGEARAEEWTEWIEWVDWVQPRHGHLFPVAGHHPRPVKPSQDGPGACSRCEFF
jgi:hypothetical protein